MNCALITLAPLIVSPLLAPFLPLLLGVGREQPAQRYAWAGLTCEGEGADEGEGAGEGEGEGAVRVRVRVRVRVKVRVRATVGATVGATG